MLISRFDDPDLSTAERAQLDKLLRSDPQARDLLEQYRKLNHRLEKLPDALENLDLSGFTQNVNRAIDLTLLRKTRSFFRHTLIPLSAAAALVIAALALFFTEAQNQTSKPDSNVEKTVVNADGTNTGTKQNNFVLLAQTPQTFDSNIVRNVSVSLMPDSTLAMAESAISYHEGPGEVIAFTGAPALKQKTTKSRKSTSMFGVLFNGST